MGVIQPDYVIVELGNEEGTEVLDKFIENKVPKKFQNLFHKTVTHLNQYCNYYISWDGSKEGWENSNEGNRIKSEFIQLAKDSIDHVSIIKIKSRGDNLDDPTIKQLDFWNGELMRE